MANVTGKVYKADGVAPAAAGGVQYTGCGKSYLAVIDTQGIFLFQNILLPCSSFTLYMEDAEGIGIGYASGSLGTGDSGKTVDVGTVILDDKAIAVAAVTPVNGTVDVPITSSVHISFSEKARASTITSANAYLKKGSATISSALAFDADGMGVTVAPAQPLTGMTLYTVYVTTGVTDLIGRQLLQTFTSTFTTIDNTPPAVLSVSPGNNATGTSQDAVVRVTFSETIDPAFTDGIKLLLNGTPISARLDLIQGGTVAALTPLSLLLTDSIYNVSVSGVRDIAGNQLVSPFISIFTTIDTIAPTVSALTTSGDLIKGNTVTVTATVDADTASVDFMVDGVLAFTDSTAPFAYSMPLAREGQAVVKAVARDQAGNRNPNSPWAKEISFTVAGDTAPLLTITAPAEENQVSTNTPVSVTVTATDDLLVSAVTLTAVMNGQTLLEQTKTNLTGKTFTPVFSFVVPFAATPGTSILITAQAKDSGGQTSAISQRTIVVKDGTAPTLSAITSPGISHKIQTRPDRRSAGHCHG